jgi:AraC-like DNA-binding protein
MLPIVVRQSRPVGPHYAIDKAWKERLERALEERGKRSWLARELGVSTASISTLLQTKTKETRLKPRIHELLGWEPVGVGQPQLSRDELRILEIAAELEREGDEHLALAVATLMTLREALRSGRNK